MHTSIPATVVLGHRVASGMNGDARFPGGTIRMQAPHFLARGLDVSPFHAGTLNVRITPWRYRVVCPRHTLAKVKWHPVEPAEDFSFFDVKVFLRHSAPVCGLIYLPHAETKPEHFQNPDVLELLLPWTEGLVYGQQISIQIPEGQLALEL